MTTSTSAREGLERAKLLQGVSVEGLARLQAACTHRRLGAGELLLERDDDTRDVYVIVEGMLRVAIYAPTGKIVLLRDLGPGDTFGEVSAIDGRPRSATVEALGAAAVAVIPAATFLDLIAREPSLSMALLRQATGYIRELTDRIYAFSSLAVSNRIHAELLRLVRESGQAGLAATTLDPAPRHADIADRISTHREAVSRELSHLARIGVVERHGKALVIRDVARLAQLVANAASS